MGEIAHQSFGLQPKSVAMGIMACTRAFAGYDVGTVPRGREENQMPLDLEIAGPVRHLAADETEITNRAPSLKRLRNSHHAVAKLFACGCAPHTISLQTGYSPSRLSTLQQDPAFRELVAHYERTQEAIEHNVEGTFREVALDATQVLHERILDDPGALSDQFLLDAVKVLADRAGHAPVQRSFNKSVNLNIGDRLDEARARKPVKIIENP